MNQKTVRIIGRCIGSILLLYLCAVYIPRAWHEPTRWNIFWALFWIEGFISGAVDQRVGTIAEELA